MKDCIALGELLIDFVQEDNNGKITYEALPGGAPCNVLAMLKKYQKDVSFIGKVGNDNFGLMLKEKIEELGINTENLILDDKNPTTLAFVHKLESGDRDFSFYRNKTADCMLMSEEINESLINQHKIFHFGTLSMTNECVFEATKKAIDIAKKNNLLISFDPNIRKPLWDSEDDLKKAIEYGLNNCDILKISDDEITYLTNENNFEKAINILFEKYNIKLITLTLGPDGSMCLYKNKIYYQPGYKNDNTIETTGAGDTFMASIINYCLEHDIDNLSDENINEMLNVANAAASIITTRKGALTSMPTIEEINALLN